MKIRILDRILVAFAGLLMLSGVAALVMQLFFGKNVVGWVSGLLSDQGARVFVIIGMILIFLLGCYCVLVLFRHRGKNEKFIMQKTDNGELAISLKALESMVTKCVEPHKELNAQSVHLENQKGGLLIRIRGTVAGGVSIPLTVDALQQQIKQYVTACSGVEVKDIKVQIESSGPDARGALFAVEAPASPALLGAAEKTAEESGTEQEDDSAMSPEEIEQVLAEMPAPSSPETEETPEPVQVTAAAAAAAELLRNEAPEEEDDRPIHQRLFSSPEEPCVMPMPPETETTVQPEVTEETTAQDNAAREEAGKQTEEAASAEEAKKAEVTAESAEGRKNDGTEEATERSEA